MTRVGILTIIILAGAFSGSHLGATALARTPTVANSGDTAGQLAPGQDPVLIAAGDIANCDSNGAEATATLIRGMAGTIATLGDQAYRSGSPQDFARCYEPTWGTEKSRTVPAVGNHEYGSRGANGYFAYFGAAAGSPAAGYYSYDLGAWHIIVLNSNCDEVGGCEADSAQGQWLREDLIEHPAACTLAYWHHPLFSSGQEHGGDDAVRPFWQLLYDAGADVVLAGHEHNYERFAPQDPTGAADPERGIREFVVGTGGASHYPFGKPLPLSESRNAETFGVLALTLHPAGFDWAFVPAAVAAAATDTPLFKDAGSAGCH